jgi:LPS sulfotransferase NodH
VGSRRFVTVVSGAPRSGTSLMMQLLEAGGAALLCDGRRPADPDNPRGYYEYAAVAATRRDPAWLDRAAGRAVKVVYPLLPDLAARCELRVIWMRRPLDEVLASQRVMLERRGGTADPAQEPRLAAVLETQLSDALAWLERSRIPRLLVDYPELIARPEPVVAEVDRFLGGGLDRDAMRRRVDPALHRQRSATESVRRERREGELWR